MLLEREGFLADLGELIDLASSGSGRLVLLAGEAGIGKSELLHAFLQSTTAARLIGACDSLSTPRPLGPLLDMVTSGSLGITRQDVVERSRDEVFGAFLEHLRRAAEPLVVVFEDLHWADEATLDLLRFLSRRLDATKVLLIASYRDDEVGTDHPLRRLLGDLATNRSYLRMQLTRLSAAAVAELAAESDVDALELHRLTAGNPFFVTEVLASGAPGVPTRISDAVLARVGRLPAPARQVLDACAVIGFRFEPQLTIGVLGSAADAEEYLEVCMNGGVLVPTERAMRFRHELARDVLLSAIGPVRKRELHRRILAVLVESASTDFSSLAHHAEGAVDSAAVLRFAPAAGRAATTSGSHREAAAQFARALRFADELGPSEHAELLEAYAFEAVLIDDAKQAETATKLALEIREREGATRERVRDLVFLANNYMRQGRNQESNEVMTAAVELLEVLPNGAEHAFVRANRAYLLMLDRENDEALEQGELAVGLALEHHDRLSLPLAYNAVGSARILNGEFDKGAQDLQYSLELAESLGLDHQVAGAYGNLGSALGEMYRFDAAEGFLRAGRDFCRQHDLDFSGGYIESWLAITLMFRGDWVEAGEVATQVLGRSGAAAITRIMALVALGRLRARRGDPDAWVSLDEALRLAEQTGTLQRIAPVRAARAEARYLAGAYEQSAGEAGAALTLARRHRHPWHVGELVHWLRSAGEAAGVRVSGTGGGTAVDEQSKRHELEPDEQRYLAEPYALDLAADHLAAARVWESLGCPYESARALGEADDQESLERARETLAGLGANPLLTSVEDKMHALGYRVARGPAASTKANPANLTKREAQVVKLLAQGMTNQEMADKLFRSVRTIDHHVSAILAKLGAGNRVEAARKATQLGLLE